jgi:hypothetical protein
LLFEQTNVSERVGGYSLGVDTVVAGLMQVSMAAPRPTVVMTPYADLTVAQMVKPKWVIIYNLCNGALPLLHNGT